LTPFFDACQDQWYSEKGVTDDRRNQEDAVWNRLIKWQPMGLREYSHLNDVGTWDMAVSRWY